MSTAKSTTTTASPRATPTRPRAASLDALNLSSLSLALPAIYLSENKDASASPSPLVLVTPASHATSWSFGTSGATLLSGASAPLEFESAPSALGLELMDLLAPPLAPSLSRSSSSSSSDADSTNSRCVTPVDATFDEAAFYASAAEFDSIPLTPIRLRASRCGDEEVFDSAAPLAF